MWLLTRYGNYSAVWKEGSMQVRARVRDDLKRLIDNGFVPADTKIIETADGHSDYRYRIKLGSQAEWAMVAYKLSLDIDYRNFKSEVMKSLGPKREHPLHEIWSILARLQPGGAYALKGSQRPKPFKRSAGDSRWQETVYGGGGARVDEVWIDELADHDLPDDEYVAKRLAEAFSDDQQTLAVSVPKATKPRTRKRGKRSGR